MLGCHFCHDLCNNVMLTGHDLSLLQMKVNFLLLCIYCSDCSDDLIWPCCLQVGSSHWLRTGGSGVTYRQ